MFDLTRWKKSEIVFVGLVVAIIVGISYVQLKTGEQKTRDAQRKADAELVLRAVVRYQDDHKVLLPSDNGLVVGCGGKGIDACVWGEGPIRDAEGVEYLKNIPRDPLWEIGRTYVYTAAGKARVYAALEYASDPSVQKNLTQGCGKGIQCNWYVEE